LQALTTTTAAGFNVLTDTTNAGFTDVTNELRRGNSREEAYKLKSDILNKCKNNVISGYIGLDGGILEIKNILWTIDLYEIQNTTIKNNVAANNGGAFSIVNSEKVTFYNVNVFDNEAVGGKGGAFYIENSTVIFNTNNVSIFKGNKANEESSAMYLGANSNVYFNTTKGAIIDMNDALTSNEGTNGNLHIMGIGKFNLYETSKINGTNVKIEARGQLNLYDNVDLFANSIGIDKDTIFGLKGNNNVQVVGGNLDLSGTLEIRKGLNSITITTNTAIANINQGAKLKINLSPRGFDNLNFTLTASSAIIGISNLETEYDNKLVKNISLSTTSTSMEWNLSGYGRTETSFGNMPDLTRNQNSVGDMYDRISILVTEGSMIDTLIDYMCDISGDVAKIKAFLTTKQRIFLSKCNKKRGK
jgi:hypothetical protein